MVGVEVGLIENHVNVFYPLLCVGEHRFVELESVELIIQKNHDYKVFEFSVVLLVQQVLENEFVFSLELAHVDVNTGAKAQRVLQLVQSYVYLGLEQNRQVPLLVYLL